VRMAATSRRIPPSSTTAARYAADAEPHTAPYVAVWSELKTRSQSAQQACRLRGAETAYDWRLDCEGPSLLALARADPGGDCAWCW
jgi:hypothetical protein